MVELATLDDESLAGIRENAGIALRFVHAHVRGFDAPTWSDGPGGIGRSGIYPRRLSILTMRNAASALSLAL